MTRDTMKNGKGMWTYKGFMFFKKSNTFQNAKWHNEK